VGRSEVGWRLRLQPLAELIALLLDRLTREGSKLPPRRALFSVVLLHKYCVCVCARACACLLATVHCACLAGVRGAAQRRRVASSSWPVAQQARGGRLEPHKPQAHILPDQLQVVTDREQVSSAPSRPPFCRLRFLLLRFCPPPVFALSLLCALASLCVPSPPCARSRLRFALFFPFLVFWPPWPVRALASHVPTSQLHDKHLKFRARHL